MKGKKLVVTIFLIGSVCYAGFVALVYLSQERLLFHPVTLDQDYPFDFETPFEEVTMTTPDGVSLHSLLFKAENPKGLVFYLHGNGGCLKGWGLNAGKFVDDQYDVFMPDYRGYGKSGGKLSGETQMHEDVQLAYDRMKELYGEENIIVIGYSMGSGPASRLAAENSPKHLILKAPFVSIRDAMINHPVARVLAIYPTPLLKYQFPNAEYLANCRMPVTLFHGSDDQLIYPGSSGKLMEVLKPDDRLIMLEGTGHNDISSHPEYREEIHHILTSG